VKKLPPIILVRWDGGDDGDAFLAAHLNVEDAVGDGDDVVVVGTYKLVGTRRLRKVVKEV